MQLFERPLFIERYVAHNRAGSENGSGLNPIGLGCLVATKYYLASGMLAHLDRLLESHKTTVLTPRPDPLPVWIESSQPIPSPCGNASALLLLSPKRLYKRWQRSLYAAAYPAVKNPAWGKNQWALLIFASSGQLLLELEYGGGKWMFASTHVCPVHQCWMISNANPNKQPNLQPCTTCQEALHYWAKWFSFTYLHIHAGRSPSVEREVYHLQDTPLIDASASSRTNAVIVLSPHSENREQISKGQSQRSVEQGRGSQLQVVERKSSFLLERYLEHLSTMPPAEGVERSQKYLWMHSAWHMTEMLRHSTDDVPLQLPAEYVYIELEQPRLLHNQEVAAFSLMPLEGQRWLFSVIDRIDQTVWKLFHEGGGWLIPRGYICPEQRCTTEMIGGMTLYRLCNSCQERLNHYTSWIAIALRMIAGDFQEQVEVREPEYMVETAERTVHDISTGKTQQRSVRHHFRVIRYLDACVYKGQAPQTKRGSWMTGRPLAESEYEVNPNAIIYVKIRSREYARTYRHQRYIHVRGKKQLIPPHYRLQPMTIATFRQLKQVQRITRVYASKYE